MKKNTRKTYKNTQLKHTKKTKTQKKQKNFPHTKNTHEHAKAN